MGTNHESPAEIACISLFEDDLSRWEAVKDRNAIADGLFVCASANTKVYCRPVCKARLPRRVNVSFYKTSSEAQAAGYRPCRRCKPDLDGVMPEDSAVYKVQAFLEKRDGLFNNSSTQESLSQMAKQAGISKWHFHRVFKKYTGMTPVQYGRLARRSVARIQCDFISDELGYVDQLTQGSEEAPPLLDFMSMLENSTVGSFSEDQSEDISSNDPDCIFWPQGIC
jgi:methylphosphotriester-DNA--protein-cysteine methyltransferase